MHRQAYKYSTDKYKYIFQHIVSVTVTEDL